MHQFFDVWSFIVTIKACVHYLYFLYQNKAWKKSSKMLFVLPKTSFFPRDYQAFVLDINSKVFFFFFSIWVFFHEHSRFTGQQGKGEGIYLTPLCHFHPLHRHLDISRAIAAESSPLHIAGSRTRTGNLWFPSASH